MVITCIPFPDCFGSKRDTGRQASDVIPLMSTVSLASPLIDSSINIDPLVSCMQASANRRRNSH